MNEAVFISDLHLHPEYPDITANFRKFVNWAINNTQKLYILGDFIHVWPGDEAIDAWSDAIISELVKLTDHGIPVYFMPGNRDFLIGKRFLRKAKLHYLQDPTVVTLGHQRVLLSHGDAYCTLDNSHQRFRKMTRNWLFCFLFLQLPYAFRKSLVNRVRHYSQTNNRKLPATMQTVETAMQKDMQRFAADILIHGHTHQPGVRTYQQNAQSWHEYTLSDWDENPSILCYNDTKYQFISILGVTNGN